METMQLIQIPRSTDPVSLSDSDVEAFFASAGLTVTVVDHCDTAGCPVCFAGVAARAA